MLGLILWDSGQQMDTRMDRMADMGDPNSRSLLMSDVFTGTSRVGEAGTHQTPNSGTSR